MNIEQKKKLIRKYLRRKLPFGTDPREKALLEDNIDIGRWAKNMEYLETQDYFKREGVDPLVVRIDEAAAFLPPLLHGDRKKRNWFIAAYPDVINYFIPSADIDYSVPEDPNAETEGEAIFHRLIESLPEQQVAKWDATRFLLYLKRFYKHQLKRRFSLGAGTGV